MYWLLCIIYFIVSSFTVPLFNLTTLEELYLDRIALPINFLQNIVPLPALKILSASGCDLHDTQGM